MPTASPRVRAAALQFAVGPDLDDNLATCLRLIDQAAPHRPDLVVLPEFINHIAWYTDAAHCHQVAVELDGPFLGTLAAKAAEHGCYLKVNVTLRRAAGQVTGTNILFGPDGQRLAVNDKQVLMGNENNFLTPASEAGPVVRTPIGALGMYACMDGVINEVARGLEVRGAQILLNSLNSFAHDEASLHIPVRAAENKVFIVAANKVGGLVPSDLVEAVAARLKIAPHFLHGAGESQIVAPDGTVLAKAPRTGEAVVVADLELAQADAKRRPDGTDLLTSRRPELYGPIGAPPAAPAPRRGAAEIAAAVYQPAGDGPAVVAEIAAAVSAAARAGVQFLVLPELVHLPGGRVTDPAAAAAESARFSAAVAAALPPEGACFVVASIVEAAGAGYTHTGVLIGRDGVRLRQPQLHTAGRHPWVTDLGRELRTVDLPFGRAAVIVGNDALYPETFRLATLQDVEVVGVPTTLLEPWEMTTGLLERAAENRLNVVAAARPGPAGTSAVIAITEDFTLWTEWKNRPFDGNITYPAVTRAAAGPGLTRASVYPAAAANRLISQRTDVVDGRPWRLVQALTGTEAAAL
ncbi:MAG: carbon-nitrogen hydrolase family protein [Anaerolineales bacterium]|nr:carbon-nitrogen hydrolase family protein [Anaerolineales bacterium]